MDTKKDELTSWTPEKLRQLLTLLENWPSISASVDSNQETFISPGDPYIHFYQHVEETARHTSGLEVSTTALYCIASAHPSRESDDCQWSWEFRDSPKHVPFVITQESMLKEMQKWIEMKTFATLPNKTSGEATIVRKVVSQDLMAIGSIRNTYKAGTKLLLTKDDIHIPFTCGPAASSICLVIKQT